MNFFANHSIKIIIFLILVPLIYLVGVKIYEKYSGIKVADDNFIEENIEKVIEASTGQDIDITFWSKEKEENKNDK